VTRQARALHPDDLVRELPSVVLSVMEVAKTLPEINLYLLGGAVRDAILNQLQDKDVQRQLSINNLDFVVEDTAVEDTDDKKNVGSNKKVKHHALELATRLQKSLGGTLQCHETFGTCTLTLENPVIDNTVIDIATARRERYEPPGLLPVVTFGTIRDDLARRDFSINALALKLTPEPLTLLDLHHSLEDLENRELRSLHPASFLDDPTRILRGARLAGRLEFHWEEKTKRALLESLEAPTLNNVSKERLKNELELTLNETRVYPALEVLEDCGALLAMFGMTLPRESIERLDVLRQSVTVPRESYLLALLLGVPEGNLKERLETFGWSLRYLASLKKLRTLGSVNQLWSEGFAKLTEAEKLTLRAFSESLDTRIRDLTLQFKERRLTGKDVLDLGLEPGPKVGSVLARVAKARDEGKVYTFDDELALAKRLVRVEREQTQEPR
jgi:tRNA nucleotidyltransferase (CCA-adding enzyme)